MKKVLILAWDFPPHNSVAAARPQSWFRYFQEQGVYPVVVTRHWDLPLNAPEDTMRPSRIQHTTVEESASGTLIRVPFNPWQRRFGLKPNGFRALLRKMISFLIVLFRHSVLRIDPDRILWKEARNYLKNNTTDCILATGEPFFLFNFARHLSREFSIPWIADYRDGWSFNQLHNLDSSLLSKIRHGFDKWHEKHIIASASAITAAAPSYLEPVLELRKTAVLHKVIFNGYEEISTPAVLNAPTPAGITIAYSGRIYPHYPVEDFIQELEEIRRENPDCPLNLLCLGLEFYPDEVKRIRNAVANSRINLISTGRLGYAEYIRRLQMADFCLLFGVTGVRWLNAKIFDYFYAGKPVILYKNDHDILESLLLKTRGGFIRNDKTEFKNYLSSYMTSFGKTTGTDFKPVHIHEFSRENQSREMVKIILQCVE